MGQRLAVLFALIAVLALPFLVRALAGASTEGGGGEATSLKRGVPTLVIVTPHVEQIRSEFGAAFARWRLRTRGTPAQIDWRAPGGTADIMKQLESTLEAAARNGEIDAAGAASPGSAGFDLFFGGGSFEHGKLKKPRTARTNDGRTITYRLGRPANFDATTLVGWYGDKNAIGTQNLYDPEQYWIGTALSGFGIVYNRDVLARLGLPEPRSFSDLCDYRMVNMVALADGRQSGSVTTTYDSILNKEGWERGWRILREMSGNARYFASASTKPPIDVSQGEAAAGMAIDFYGRSQAQMLLKPGMDPASVRVGYVDPEGAVYIDADPASILNGCSNLALARSFIEFCLTEEAQALWQFPTTRSAAPGAPRTPDGRPFGPDEYELRRMPIRPIMYQKYQAYMIDQVNPFTIASDVPQRGWRSAIAPLMAAFGIDAATELRDAWRDLNAARAESVSGGFPAAALAEMEQLFYAMPTHTMKDGSTLVLSETTYKAIDADTNSWKDLDHGKRSLIAYTRFFRDNDRRVSALCLQHQTGWHKHPDPPDGIQNPRGHAGAERAGVIP